jgi:hypothetical protein
MSDSVVSPIVANTFLTYCWICGIPFSHDCQEERHHVIPRAYGGTNGPQVSLCDSHHSALHQIALKMYTGKSFFNLMSGRQEQDARLLYLASVAYNARILTEKDPNKKQMLVLHISGQESQELNALKSIYKVGREKLIGLAIKSLYDRHFKR